MRSDCAMLRIRMVLIGVVCATMLVAAAPAGAALKLDGFPATFPKAAALCAKADKGKLGTKLAPSKGKVLAACRKLRQSYSDALTQLLAKTDPLKLQMKEIVRAQREVCLQARRTKDKTACKAAQFDARNRLAPLRAQIAEAQKTARASYEQARKTFWAAIRKLRGAAGLKPDTPPGEPQVTDVPRDSELDQR
jgi:hypothetical protein